MTDGVLDVDPPELPRQRGPRRKAGRRNPTTPEELHRRLRQLGAVIEPRRCGSGHYRVSLPDGKGLVFLSSTRGDKRSLDNECSDLRRRGVDVRR